MSILRSVWWLLLPLLAVAAENNLDGFAELSGAAIETARIGDGPVVVLSDSRKHIDIGMLGCLYHSEICNEAEVCFDDLLFGRCIDADEAESNRQQLVRFDDLSESGRVLLNVELERLLSEGYGWTDALTQCILHEATNAIANGFEGSFDDSVCQVFEASSSLDEINEDELASDVDLINDSDLVEEVPVSQEVLLLEDALEKALDQDNDDALLETELLLPVEYRDEYEKRTHKRSDSVFEKRAPTLLIGNDHDNLGESSDNDDSRYKENDFDKDYDSFDDDISYNIPFDDEKNYYNEVDYNEYGDYTEDEEEVESYLSDPSQYYLVDENNEVYGIVSEEDLKSALDNLDEMEEERSRSKRPDFSSFVVNDDDVVDTGSGVFTRLGRLDVKKPGPFFPNSANNFFLDKLLAKDDADYESGDKAAAKDDDPNDPGQLEYESPLSSEGSNDAIVFAEKSGVAPKSSSWWWQTEQGLAAAPNFVHIGLKKRIDTWQQGDKLIQSLANEFGVPQHALDQRLIENEHVQFRVAPNPQGIDAPLMASLLDGDKELQKRLGGASGVEISAARAGSKSDGVSLLPSASNMNLLMLVVALSSAMAAFVVLGAIGLLVRRRCRIDHKVHRADDRMREKGNVQDEYQQLCRDWSRSSKKVVDPQAAVVSTSMKKQLQNKESKESSSSTRSSTSSWTQEESGHPSMDISTGHMVLAYMEDHLKNKQRLEQEWVALCGYEAEPCATSIAFRAENKKKNRYPDKLPYDHNRVVLNAALNARNNDYINASPVTDHDPRNPSYVVTQAPLADTIADFWQMVWEQGCVVIVMLTQLSDNGHQLCARYWPSEGSALYDVWEVHLVSEHVWCVDYLVRSFYLKNTRTGETRTITQFHFQSWPPHGVPASIRALLEFRRKVNKSYRGRSCPICVHCSDGVGRSGTYVLLDMVLNRMAKGCKEIDIAATLEHIRDQRGGMVQSKQQFEFSLMAVAEEVHAILKALPQ